MITQRNSPMTYQRRGSDVNDPTTNSHKIFACNRLHPWHNIARVMWIAMLGQMTIGGGSSVFILPWNHYVQGLHNLLIQLYITLMRQPWRVAWSHNSPTTQRYISAKISHYPRRLVFTDLQIECKLLWCSHSWALDDIAIYQRLRDFCFCKSDVNDMLNDAIIGGPFSILQGSL